VYYGVRFKTQRCKEIEGMAFISIFNDVLGPVMRGPSSSHTAGSYHIGRIVRSLWGQGLPSCAEFSFDPDGSYSRVYRQQSVDGGLAAGLINLAMTDEKFYRSVDVAAEEGIAVRFRIEALNEASHPNTVKIHLHSPDQDMTALAASIGGGSIVFSQVDGWPLEIDGKTHDLIILCLQRSENRIRGLLPTRDGSLHRVTHPGQPDKILLHYRSAEELGNSITGSIGSDPDVVTLRRVSPLFYPQKHTLQLEGSTDLIQAAAGDLSSLGEIGMAFESIQLNRPESMIRAEMKHRFDVMQASVRQGLEEKELKLRLLKPTAQKVLEAENTGALAVGGIHLRAAARAMAVMHTANSGGVICAAPTGGSSGVLPGVLVSLIEDRKLPYSKVVQGLFAAGAAGMIIARRATFAAEVAGCQVEIGAAGAMAAAAVTDIAGGTLSQALDAAAISLQNSMGSVCDLVQGRCEIPCHTRNAAAAANAFVCADLILGGYVNPIPFDETVDASMAVGRMLPSALRCTSRGGLAVTPSALRLDGD